MEEVVPSAEEGRKPCRKCGSEDKRANGRCRPCARAHSSVHRQRDVEDANTKHRDWRAANPEKDKSYRLKYKYDITFEQYDTMLKAQGGVCAICGQPETAVDTKTGEVKRLAVDHHRASGQVRMLLCQRHNQGIGLFGEDAELLRWAIAYLEYWKMQREVQGEA
jgi:hypothetical protein